MAAANTDKLMKVGLASATTLDSNYTINDTTVTVQSTSGWPTDTGVTFAMDVIDSQGAQVAGTYNEFVGTVDTATSITNVDWADGSGDRNYTAGATTRVYIPVSKTRENRIVTWGTAEHNQDGTHSDITADSLNVSGASTLGAVTATSLSISGSATSEGWAALGDVPDTVTANGNKSYDLVFNSNDLTDTITPGMRLKTTRTVAAPTQCTSLNGTTQYYSKSSPNKLTFTDDFVVSAWIKLSSYAAGAIASRYNGTSGWLFYVDASGAVILQGNNAGAANYTKVISYQSLPLNKWVHVAAQLDMSTAGVSTTTSYVMIDGVDVPCQKVTGGTAPTALIQAGNLEIGTYNAGVFFPGKIAQVAVYNAKVTQATILASINQGLSGSETSLASAYSFNNAITDLNTTTPNDLTANGSAVATNADSPFGNSGASSTLDYAIVMAAAFSTNTTLTVQVPEGCTIPSSGGVTTVDYSTQSVPYGFPRSKDKFDYVVRLNSSLLSASVSSGTAVNVGGLTTQLLTVPTGSWLYDVSGVQRLVGSTAADKDVKIGLNTTSATMPTSDYADTQLYSFGSAQTEIRTALSLSNAPIVLSSQTKFYVVGAGSGAGTLTNLGFYATTTNQPTVFRFKCAYV